MPKSKKETLEAAVAEINESVKTWDDMFTLLESNFNGMRESFSAAAVFNTMFVMYAFLWALKELPDEGNIQVLTRHMLDILINRDKEVLGLEIDYVTTEDAQRLEESAKVQALAELARRLIEPIQQAVSDHQVSVDTAPNRQLH